MKIKKDDQVLIISGKDKGKKGKVIKVSSKEKKIVVEGVNIVKKHKRAQRSGEKGQIVEVPVPVSVSNVKMICPKCERAVRVGYKLVKQKKYRMCKKCGEEI